MQPRINRAVFLDPQYGYYVDENKHVIRTCRKGNTWYALVKDDKGNVTEAQTLSELKYNQKLGKKRKRGEKKELTDGAPLLTTTEENYKGLTFYHYAIPSKQKNDDLVPEPDNKKMRIEFITTPTPTPTPSPSPSPSPSKKS